MKGKRMSIKVHIPDYMRPLTENKALIEVKGKTVGECLSHLLGKFPGIENELFDKDSRLHIYLHIFINDAYAYPEELIKPVLDGDKLYIYERES